MDSTKHEMLADTIGVESELYARRRFWLAHMRIGFGIFLLETLVVMLYLHLTPAGPHRTLLWPIIVSWAACASIGVLVAPIVAGRS